MISALSLDVAFGLMVSQHNYMLIQSCKIVGFLIVIFFNVRSIYLIKFIDSTSILPTVVNPGGRSTYLSEKFSSHSSDLVRPEGFSPL